MQGLRERVPRHGERVQVAGGDAGQREGYTYVYVSTLLGQAKGKNALFDASASKNNPTSWKGWHVLQALPEAPPPPEAEAPTPARPVLAATGPASPLRKGIDIAKRAASGIIGYFKQFPANKGV